LTYQNSLNQTFDISIKLLTYQNSLNQTFDITCLYSVIQWQTYCHKYEILECLWQYVCHRRPNICLYIVIICCIISYPHNTFSDFRPTNVNVRELLQSPNSVPCNIFVILKPKFPWKGFHFELLKQNMIKYWKELDQLYEQSLQSSQRHQNSCAKCEYTLSKWLHSLKYWVLLSSNSKIQTYLTILHKLVCSCLA